ncbi:MAG: hypothetical protein ACM3SR_19260 [Ignavibacteriales bacterium]
MPNPKIVIVVDKNGVDSVTVSSRDALDRQFGYELCKSIEHELIALSEAVKRRFPLERAKEVKQ